MTPPELKRREWLSSLTSWCRIGYDDGLSEEDVLYVFEADLKAPDRTWDERVGLH